jgi:hypothetical protein
MVLKSMFVLGLGLLALHSTDAEARGKKKRAPAPRVSLEEVAREAHLAMLSLASPQGKGQCGTWFEPHKAALEGLRLSPRYASLGKPGIALTALPVDATGLRPMTLQMDQAAFSRRARMEHRDHAIAGEIAALVMSQLPKKAEPSGDVPSLDQVKTCVTNHLKSAGPALASFRWVMRMTGDFLRPLGGVNRSPAIAKDEAHARDAVHGRADKPSTASPEEGSPHHLVQARAAAAARKAL